MNEPLSKEEYEKIIASAPCDMELPVYIGKHNNKPCWIDLIKAKSIAMNGFIGISNSCYTSLTSLVKTSGQILQQKYFICVNCPISSLIREAIPFENEYITNTCTAIYHRMKTSSIINSYSTTRSRPIYRYFYFY